MRDKVELQIVINARVHQLSVKAGWRKTGKGTFTTSETE